MKDLIRRLSGKSCWLDVEPVFSGRSADSIFGRQHTRSRINKLYLLAYLHTMALSFFISLFVTYTDIANRQTTNIFFGFLGIHSSDAREKKEKKRRREERKKKEKEGEKEKKEKIQLSSQFVQPVAQLVLQLHVQMLVQLVAQPSPSRPLKAGRSFDNFRGQPWAVSAPILAIGGLF